MTSPYVTSAKGGPLREKIPEVGASPPSSHLQHGAAEEAAVRAVCG